MKYWMVIIFLFCLILTVNANAEEKVELANAEEQEELWNFGAGLRFNYLRLTGGIKGYDAETGNKFDIDYSAVGMDNYAPSVALALAGKYKKFNLFFGASRGVYTGSFNTKNDITIDDETIPAGSKVDGKIDMGIYSLSTTYGLIQKKHDLGLGLGILLLDMGMEFEAQGKTVGEPHIFPMPFLALSGRLNFDKFKIVAVGGGAYFNGEMDGYDYTVWYYTGDLRVGYDFYQKGNYTATFNLGYRSLYMDSEASKGDSWFTEEDRYAGPFFSILVKYTRYK